MSNAQMAINFAWLVHPAHRKGPVTSFGSRMTRWSIDAIWRECVPFLLRQLPTGTVCVSQINISITITKRGCPLRTSHHISHPFVSIFIPIWYSMRLDFIERSRFAGMAVINYNRNHRNTINSFNSSVRLFDLFGVVFIKLSPILESYICFFF